MRHWTGTILALAVAAGLSAGCQDAATRAPEPQAGGPEVEAVEAQATRSSGEVWSEILVEWAKVQDQANVERKSIEQFEQMDPAVARLAALAEELEASLEMPDFERRRMEQSIMVLRGSVLELENTVTARIPGQLPDALVMVASQLWVVQEAFPAGELPGEPLPKPEGIGMPRS